MNDNRPFLWAILIVLMIIVLWWALDHVLFAILPMPASAPLIAK